MKRIGTALLALAFTIGVAHGQAAQLGAGQVWGNSTSAQRNGRAENVTAILDRALGSTRGSILERGSAGWRIQTPGTTGLPYVSGGTGADPGYAVLGIVGGGTNCGAASGTCLDNITGFASTGLLNRSGAGAYSFFSLSGNGTSVPTTTGSLTSGNCVKIDAGGNFVDAGGACGGSGSPGGTNGQIQFNSAGSFGGFTASGDATINTGTGVVSVGKTGGVAFAASATTDTTNASNIGSGTINTARLPSPFTNGTASGNTSAFATTTGSHTTDNCAKWDASGNVVDAGAACGSGSGAVSSVSNADGSLTISPTTGAVVGSLNLSHANTWAAIQTFGDGDLKLSGSSSGSSIIKAPATGGGTATLFAGSDTILGAASAATLTNKTFDTAGAGNSFSINGVAATANTGTGSVVRATSPTISGATVTGSLTATGLVTNADLAAAVATTTKCNATTSSASPTDCQSAYLHSKDYGATGNGSTDDATALQSWINACESTGIPCFLDAGSYLINSALSVTGKIAITGAGRFVSQFVLGTTTQDGIDVNTSTHVDFSSFGVVGSVSATAGDLIQVTAASSFNTFSTFKNLYFSNGWNNLDCIKCSNQVVDDVYFAGHNNVGYIADNTATPSSDGSITNSNFSGNSGSTNLKIIAAAGMKITGNKFIQGAHGIVIAPAAGETISDVLITGNSIEGHSTDGITATKGSSTVLKNVTIVGNQIAGQPTPINLNDTNANWLEELTITGNVIQPVSGTGIVISAANGFVISSNEIYQSGSSTGISIASTAANGSLTGNNYHGLNTNVSNSSTTTRPGTPQQISFGSNASIAQSGTVFVNWGDENGSETNVQGICPFTATFRNLYINSAAPASGQTVASTIRVANADTALTCTITGPGTTCNDTTHAATCTAGQTFSLKVVTSATTGSLGHFNGGVEFDVQ